MKKLLFVALLVAGCGNGITGDTGAAACITATACGIEKLGTSICTQSIEAVNEPAVQGALHIDAQQVNCIASAGSNCDAARACLNYGKAAEACSGNSSMCDGSDWVACDARTGTNGANGTRRFHCGDIGAGATCVVGASVFGVANVDCGYGSCSGASSMCLDNNTLQTCIGGIVGKVDCGRNGGTCVPASGLTPAQCGGSGPGCANKDNGDSTISCDGNTLVYCDNQRQGRIDCGRDNLKCLPTFSVNGSTPNPQYGCYLASECDPNNFTAVCTGTQLRFCNKGKISTIDCKGMGFTACDPSNGGTCTRS